MYAQAGTSFNGVVATFLDASGNTNLERLQRLSRLGRRQLHPGNGLGITRRRLRGDRQRHLRERRDLLGQRDRHQHRQARADFV